jgi:outer membrane protein assembly factor BamB
VVPTPAPTPISKPPVTVDIGQNDSRDGRQDNGTFTIPLKLQWTAPDVGNISEFVTDGVTLVGWFADYRDTITTYAGWDLKTGKLKWGPESTATFSSLSIGDGSVLITGGPALIALDPATGKQKWSTKVPLAAEDETLVYNGVAYTEAGRYSMATGQYLGALQLPRNDGGMRMAYGGGCILAQVLGTVACMNPTTGVQIWQRTLNIIGPNTTPPVYSNGRVYVYNDVTRQPDVLDVRTGAVVGHAQVPLAIGDRLSYNWQTNGMYQAIHVVAQHVPDGKAAWTYTLPVAKDGYHVTVIQMVLSNNVLYVTGMSLDTSPIHIYALDANTGRLLWSSDNAPGLDQLYSIGNLTVSPPYIALRTNVGGRDTGVAQVDLLRMAG